MKLYQLLIWRLWIGLVICKTGYVLGFAFYPYDWTLHICLYRHGYLPLFNVQLNKMGA